MHRPSKSLFEDINNKFQILNKTRLRIEDLYKQGLLSKKIIEHIYESLFLNAHIHFCSFLEDLFVGLLVKNNGYVSGRKIIKPKVDIYSYKVAYQLILGDKKSYVDWLPYKNTSNLANIFFKSGKPFTQLVQNEKDLLSKCHTVRNAIAHKSQVSKKKFLESVVQHTPLLPTEKNPSSYLRGLFRRNPEQTRYELYTTNLLIIAKKLSQ